MVPPPSAPGPYGEPSRGSPPALGGSLPSATGAYGQILGHPLIALVFSLILPYHLFTVSPLYAQDSGKFFWAQVQRLPGTEVYPEVYVDILNFLEGATSISSSFGRRAVPLKGPLLAVSPFLAWSGREKEPDLSEQEASALRDYLVSGGFLWIDDNSGQKYSSFDRFIRKQMSRVFPESDFKVLPSTHAVFRSFFLIRSIGGREVVQDHIEGIDYGGRTCVIYSRNDLMGSWSKEPGASEIQRTMGKRLVVNIILYCLTGTYKLDAVHQPFIMQKLRGQ